MNLSKAVQGEKVRRGALLLSMLVWLGLVAVWGRHAKLQVANMPLWTVHTRSAVFDWAWDLAAAVLSRTLLFAPVAFLMVLLLEAHRAPRKHTLSKSLLAIGLSVGACAALIAFGCWPVVVAFGAYNLLLPTVGSTIGACAGLAWNRGPSARWSFLLASVLAALALLASMGWALTRTLEPEPLSLQQPSVSADEKRYIYDLFAEKNPLKLEAGRVVTIVLTEHDVNVLLALGLSVGHTARIARVRFEADRATLQATSPLSSRFLNVTAQGTVLFDAGQLSLHADRLRIGGLELPRTVLGAVSPLVARVISEDPRFKPALHLLHALALRNGKLTVTYGHGNLPDGFIAGLFHDASSLALDVPSIRNHVHGLVAAAREMPRDRETRLAAAVQTAFRLARQRSTQDRAVAENRSALLALGIVLGHPGVEALIGNFIDPGTRLAARREFEGTTLRHREDWTKHFFVSAALTIVSAGRLSNATGLFKEEKDSGGGSGFSFGDLLADRAGTTFAEFATHDQRSASALQDRISRGFVVDDYFPQADGLPENLQDADFRARYGGVGGKEYLRLKAEIERRIANCPAYKAP